MSTSNTGIIGWRAALRRGAAVAAVAGLAVVSSCSSGSTQSQGAPNSASTSSSTGVDVEAAVVPAAATVVGPAAAAPDAYLTSVISTWTSMTSTLYSHKYVEDPVTGVYQFDCVGATSYFLAMAAPHANLALDGAFGIHVGYVPTPSQYVSFIDSLPESGTSAWLSLTSPADLVGGEIIAVPPPTAAENPDQTTVPGHAMVAAGPAVALSDGGYAVLVYDSTATPHGPEDTRLTDPRNQPLPPATPGGAPRPSGLGRGTIELRQMAGVPGWFLYWSVAGTFQYGGAVALGRPLS
jgi:hypothetical protein